MKRFFYLTLIIFSAGFFSCNTSETTDNSSNELSEELAKLKSEKRELENQLNEKDSTINQSIMLFNEIEDNLAMINLKEDEIRLKSKDVELSEDGKQWIIQEIQNINYLREENAKKANALSKQLKNKNQKIAELEKMVSNLMVKIQAQDEEIDMLRAELEDLDREYVELLEAYEEQSTLAFELMKEANQVYYAYGTEEELEKAGVIVKEGGFIGIGKKATLKGDFNDDYFTEVDLTKTNSIDIDGGKKIKIITDHPSSAYTIEDNGTKHTIKITEPKNFWKVSKYLVVVVD